MKKRVMFLIVMVIFCIFGNLVAGAEDYPSKPITFIVPYSTGGMGDVTGRLLSKPMGDYLGQPVIVKNIPGAGGAVGLSALAKAKPDGYTIANSTTAAITTTPQVREVPYDLESFDYLGSYAKQEWVLCSSLDAPWDTFEELIEYAKQNPNIVVVGETGCAWTTMVLNKIALEEGIKWRILPFKGGGEGSAAILGGHIDLLATGTGTPADLAARAGKLKIMVVLSKGHLDDLPDIENLQDKGYNFYSLLSRHMLAPAGLPDSIRQKLEDAIRIATEDPEFIDSINKLNMMPKFYSGSEDAERLQDGYMIVKELIKGADITEK